MAAAKSLLEQSKGKKCEGFPRLCVRIYYAQWQPGTPVQARRQQTGQRIRIQNGRDGLQTKGRLTAGLPKVPLAGWFSGCTCKNADAQAWAGSEPDSAACRAVPRPLKLEQL